jgi:hypothetical protein
MKKKKKHNKEALVVLTWFIKFFLSILTKTLDLVETLELWFWRNKACYH